VERLAGGSFDVIHSAHPLLIPTNGGARVVTIHDLDFLDHPERTRAEIRRDYPALAALHAVRADGILTSSQSTAGDIVGRIGVPHDRVAVAPPGPPRWTSGGRHAPRDPAGYIVFIVNVFSRMNLEDDAPRPWAVLVFLLGLAISFGLWLWNRVFRQGKTGQSVGKTVLKLRLVDGVNTQPIGPAKALGRELIAWVFGNVPLIDVLWPLWDQKKQTLHDKVMDTYVISVGQQEAGTGY